ncbi:PucR family transcriptional regulator [Arthrobacter sp. BB-1]|uniref:PucR family transcriptional regulator n=1 Tax=unclassified Arthrobacter TaxID=235627 RepID=UPI001112C183|nr:MULTISPECIES: PucR family transcriptional regulator [unclassified Arthrobacter]TNB73625.1 PucR family transcriptional regulator [Arthrobacter sp. BB-1]
MRRNAPSAGDRRDQLDAVTLDQFLAALPREVVVVNDAGNGQAPLRWVEPSELEDPTPYLLDGEFVLTAGLPFREGGGNAAARADEYVRGLVAAGVAALGFGLEPYYDAVPNQVVAACRQHGLTLVEVPASIPFAALGLEFSKLLESGNAQVFRQLAETNRHLMRAVLSARPEHELLAALIQRVPVWAVLVGTDGRVRARAGAAVGLSQLQPLLKRLVMGSGPRVETETLETPEGTALVFGHPLRSTRDATLGSLVLGTDRPLTPAQNNVVSSVVGLLELLVRQRTSGSLAPSQLATALLLHPESLSGGGRGLDSLQDLLAQSVSGTRQGPVRVVQGVRAQAAAATPDGPVRELLQWRRLFDTKMVELTDYGFAAVTRLKVDEPLLSEVEQLGWRLVVGEPTGLPGLAAAYRRASALRPRVLNAGRSLREEELTWSVTGLLGGDAGALLAARLLAPILELGGERRASQLRILRSWLAAHGSWDATAKDLGLHRNSVRRQINAVAELLGMDLGQAQARAELWIALQYADDAAPDGLAEDGT